MFNIQIHSVGIIFSFEVLDIFKVRERIQSETTKNCNRIFNLFSCIYCLEIT